MTKKLVWRPVVGFEDHYEVSSDGRVRRTVDHRGKRVDREISQKVAQRYLDVCLSAHNKKGSHRVHRLVAMAFLGPAPSEKHQVNHIDGDRLNNCVTNLEWCTASENVRHARDTGLVLNPSPPPLFRGEDHPISKLDERSVQEIRYLTSLPFTSDKRIGDIYGVSKTAVKMIAMNRNWPHVSGQIMPSQDRIRQSIGRRKRRAA